MEGEKGGESKGRGTEKQPTTPVLSGLQAGLERVVLPPSHYAQLVNKSSKKRVSSKTAYGGSRQDYQY